MGDGKKIVKREEAKCRGVGIGRNDVLAEEDAVVIDVVTYENGLRKPVCGHYNLGTTRCNLGGPPGERVFCRWYRC